MLLLKQYEATNQLIQKMIEDNRQFRYALAQELYKLSCNWCHRDSLSQGLSQIDARLASVEASNYNACPGSEGEHFFAGDHSEDVGAHGDTETTPFPRRKQTNATGSVSDVFHNEQYKPALTYLQVMLSLHVFNQDSD